MNYLTVDRFYKQAPKLRAEFDANFADPLRAHAKRFVWDHWHVPGEFNHLRTPAYTYFSPKLYEPFHRHLVRWGRENLGCHDISPPWLSCYVEGGEQRPHQDKPHGPLAFVYSLSPRRRKFTGGETLIVRPRTRIPPEFNRLVLFNPSLNHGVTKVRGTQDPREGRLVIHGWFVNPRPFWVGALTVKGVRQILDQAFSEIPFAKLGPGFGAFRLWIDRDGRVRKVRTLAETFQRSKPMAMIEKSLCQLQFGKIGGTATLTLPLRID